MLWLNGQTNVTPTNAKVGNRHIKTTEQDDESCKVVKLVACAKKAFYVTVFTNGMLYDKM